MSHVRVSFEIPEYVADADGIGTSGFLGNQNLWLKLNSIYQASTELFGKCRGTSNRENPLPTITVWGCQNVCLLDNSEL